MRKIKIIASTEANKGASHLMEKSGKRIPSKDIFETEVDGEIPLQNEISPMPLDLVDSNLYIGNYIGASELAILKNYGITHIINTAIEIPNYFEDLKMFKYINLKLTDDPTPGKEDLKSLLDPVYQYIINTIKEYPLSKIFVHCHAGKSRSASIIIYYLMKKYNLSFENALKRLKEIRFIVEPNTWYTKVLKNL